VTDAKDLALDKLGVHDSDALFEILEEPTKGFLGRTKGVARVRARIAPKAPPPKNERGRKRGKSNNKDRNKNRNRNDEGKSAKSSGGGQKIKSDENSVSSGDSKVRSRNRNPSRGKNAADADRGSANAGSANAEASATQGQKSNKGRSNKSRVDKPKKEDTPVEQVIERVEDFLSGLIGAFGFDGEVTSNLDGDDLMAKVSVSDGALIGPKGRTLDAIQELTRVSAQRLGPTSARIKVDVGGYREARKIALVKFAGKAAETAIADKVEVVLEPMSSADRKILHDALGEIDGVGSRSAGNEPRRRVVVVPEQMADSGDQPAPDEEE
jgi:spoIIIJ-associated protein